MPLWYLSGVCWTWYCWPSRPQAWHASRSCCCRMSTDDPKKLKQSLPKQLKQPLGSRIRANPSHSTARSSRPKTLRQSENHHPATNATKGQKPRHSQIHHTATTGQNLKQPLPKIAIATNASTIYADTKDMLTKISRQTL